MSPLSKHERSDPQLAEAARAAEPRQVVEEVGDVRGDVLVGGEEPEVLVDPRRGRVVVARAQMDVTAQRVPLASDDQRRLGVDLAVRKPIGDVHARALERPRPLDVA